MILIWSDPALPPAVLEVFDVQNHGILEADYGDAFDAPLLTLTAKEGHRLYWVGAWYRTSPEKPNYYVWSVFLPDDTQRYFVVTRQEGQNDWFSEQTKSYAEFLASSIKKKPQVNRFGFIALEADDNLPPNFTIRRLNLSVKRLP